MFRWKISSALVLSACALVWWAAGSVLLAAPYDPSAPDYTGRKGGTLYVSKLGDNSDGTSWEKAFQTVQAAMSAVPDAKGGHRIIVRPDTYMEQNVYAAFEGAPGAYNVLQADFDGKLGSGATGMAVLDASHPKRGNASGWANSFLQSAKTSGEVWDRWIVRRIYATGADAGVFWDIRQDFGTHPSEPLTIVVEDCVGIGRAFGGGIAGHKDPRADEPLVFRRCLLWSLDWWGDAAGAYVRAENTKLPEHPDAVFEDCTLVGPDNAFQAGNPGFEGYTRVKFKDCRLISINCSMPEGCPSTGIIFSTMMGKYLHVDLENCLLMGYKVFGAGGPQFHQFGMNPPGTDGGPISYTIKGNVRAYVRYDQPIPKGFRRLGAWPQEAFNLVAPSTIGQWPPTGCAIADPSGNPTTGAEDQDDQRMAWWREARFGMFIHFGFWSEREGELKPGEVPNIGSRMLTTPVAKYETLAGQFNPVRFDAGQWVGLAKQAGMKYLVFTTKHHDGLCLFDSKHTTFDVMDATPFKQDICKELADECRKQGVKVCWYHSILDWLHPDAEPIPKHHTCCGARFPEFVEKQLWPQCEELLKNYGPIGVMWFDGEWTEGWTEEKGQELYDHLRKIQPDLIINDRVGRGRQITRAERRENVDDTREFAGDFGTPEQTIPAGAMPGVDWETCMTMNNSWGFQKADQNWKSTEQVIRILVDVVSKGGNLLLNVGPTAEGVIPQPSVERLQAIGSWMRVNGESIYGTSASVLPALPWGRCTVKLGKLYLHVFNWPADGKLHVPGLKDEVAKAYLLADKQRSPLTVTSAEGAAMIAVPQTPLDPIDTVIVVETSTPNRSQVSE